MPIQPKPLRPPSPDTPPYTALAAGYDVVMAHVDYDDWAAYVDELLHAFHPGPRSILELGCGTGSLAIALCDLDDYDYQATDAALAMIETARAKAEAAGADVTFEVMDFTAIEIEEPVDAVLLLYDGLNYLLSEADVRKLLNGAYDALRPGGLLIMDQSTPANSINNEAYFEDWGSGKAFRYRRRSRYDASTRLHTTTFDLTVEGRRAREQHVQRAYTLDEIGVLVEAAGFEVAAAYDGFTTEPADAETERIHWVLRRSEV